eukprot:CAMPEP_0176424572 /NCGR_PEP_ID=MMETSP0127-20121128/10906_1 /TAXON_ID=938130 /ORGANISM="Platyophrya macrostoma, Strain WH" /LENGTH=454 /DNA_ID=CAMNT_0017805633 /DNA_START=33 /DNA_END=1397 /DNA_ORIENTATION=+
MFSKVATRSAKGLFTDSKANFSLLKKRIQELIPQRQAELKEIKEKYGNKQIGTITVEQVIGGMRGMKGLFWDLSALDANEGIRFRGHSIPEASHKLQKVHHGHEPLPEAFLWLLLTGDIPKEHEFKDISAEILEHSELPADVEQFVKNLPTEMHPMTQLSISLLRLQTTSKFQKAYSEGIHKSKYWSPTYDDVISLIAKIPRLAALIYRNKYKDGKFINPDKHLDWAGNYSHMLGYERFEIKEAIRGYLSIHSDHEGGNVSAHTTHLVGSALADPFLSYSAGVNGLAGPLHGLANQEVLRWLLDLKKELGDDISEAKVKEFAYSTLSSGKVIPGYGHAVLRDTDPRFMHLRQFAQRYIKDDPLVDLTGTVFKVVPPILKELGKVKNPYPNVDAHSGVILYHYGLREFDYYTVIFAVSRALGAASSLVWSRALGLPIERPGSIDVNWIRNKFKDA